MPTLVDVSHEVGHGTVTYPGLPSPIVCDYLSREASTALYATDTTFQIGKIEMVANTGTYVDSPFHRFEDGLDLAALPLDSLAELDGVLIDATSCPVARIDEQLFEDCDVQGKAVLVRTGWDRHWLTPNYGIGHPFLTAEIATSLVRNGARLVGIDSLNIDDITDGFRPVHTILLGAGIPIVEHLCNLGALPPTGFRFHAVPVKFKRVGTFPVRAYAVIA